MNKKTSIKTELEESNVLIYTNKGVSMMPLLRQNRDLMIIEKKIPGQLKKYDAVLFMRANGQYVLHRILKVREKDYWIVGDNCVSGEYVTEDQILGVLTGVIRDGKQINVTDLGYRLYVHLWCDCYPVRFFILRCKNKVFGVLRRIKRMILGKQG